MEATNTFERIAEREYERQCNEMHALREKETRRKHCIAISPNEVLFQCYFDKMHRALMKEKAPTIEEQITRDLWNAQHGKSVVLWDQMREHHCASIDKNSSTDDVEWMENRKMACEMAAKAFQLATAAALAQQQQEQTRV